MSTPPMPSPHRPTTEWPETLQAAKHGQDAAWDQIYGTLIGPITGYLSSRGATDPDDLAAETFLQVARDISGFDGDESSFRSWVFVIAHRRLIDSWRAAERRPNTVASSNGAEPQEPTGDVEQDAMVGFEAEWVDDVLDRLTEDQRMVLTLRVVGDLSLAESASVMGKSIGAVKALQRRAVLSLREEIERGRVSL